MCVCVCGGGGGAGLTGGPWRGPAGLAAEHMQTLPCALACLHRRGERRDPPPVRTHLQVGIPFYSISPLLYYHKDIFKQYNLTVPQVGLMA